TQRAKNLAELNKYTLSIGGQIMPVTERMFTRIVAPTLNPDEPYIVLIFNGTQVCNATVPVAKTPPPTPHNTSLPSCGQIGQNVVITDHCDGIIAPTDSCSIGGVPLQPLAESPRARVLLNTNQTPGATQIKYVEQGKESSGPFQNLGIRVSSPNTNLLRNQKTTMDVVAEVQDIQQVVSLDVVNDTPGIVSISGGDNQHFTIRPADVQQDGSYHQTFTVTANQAGTWGATAMVSCANESSRPMAAAPQAVGSPNIERAQQPVLPPGAGHALPTPSPSPHASPSPCVSPPPPAKYSVKVLGILPRTDGGTPHCTATGVNDVGNIVGACTGHYTSGPPSGGWRAFRTDAGGAPIKKVDELAFPVGFTGGSSFATAVNAAGHVVGFYTPTGSSDDKAFWHDGGKKSKLISLHTKFAISRAFALNVHDDVVGAAYSPTFGPILFGITFGGHA